MLVEMLRQDPGVFVTRPKEPHYLAFADQSLSFDGPGDDLTINSRAVTDTSAYEALYESAGASGARGDASVSSLYFPEQSLSIMRRRFPGARVVAVLREPASRAFSAYSFLRVRGYEPEANFLAAIEKEPERVRANWHFMWHYVGMGRYARQLRPFLDELGPDRVCILYYEDLTRDPEAAARQVFGFLNVAPSGQISAKRINKSGKPRSQALQRSILWATRQRWLRESVRSTVPFTVREYIRGANLRDDEMPRQARAALADVFDEEVAELRSLLASTHPEALSAAPGWLGGAVTTGDGRT
jgi:hypothetical protein